MENKNTKLTIIGNGPEHDNLEKYFNNRKINFLGNVSRKKMLKYLSQSDCIICSSFHETFGVGLIEALNYGIPIISSNCEGPSDIIKKFNELIVSTNDIRNFQNAMIKMINNKSKFKKNKIIVKNEQNFGNKQYFKKFKKILKNIINE